MTAPQVKILIVDDEERLLRVLRLGLKPLGFDVLTSTTAEAALDLILQKPLDLILTDIRLPGMSGVDLVYELERLQIGLPVIVMTAFADVDTAVKSLKHGASDYIRKPFSVEELEALMREVLAKQPPSVEQTAVAPLQEGVDRTEKDLIIRALESAGHNKARAAKILKISERTLWYKLKKHNLA